MNYQGTGLMTSVEGLVRSTEDNLQNLLWLFSVLLGVLIVLGVWNLISGGSPTWASTISNLFLKVTIKNPLRETHTSLLQPESHFRAVSTKSATLITSNKLEKGQLIEIDLSSLPNYPEKGVLLPGQVSYIAPVQGCDSFLTEIRFNRSQDPVIKSLLNYVRRLSQASGN